MGCVFLNPSSKGKEDGGGVLLSIFTRFSFIFLAFDISWILSGTSIGEGYITHALPSA